MVTLFPQLLDWGFFGPTLLRVAAGVFLLSLAWRHLHNNRAAALAALTSRLGTLASFGVWYMGLLELLAGASLLVGFLTQLGALAAIIVSLQMLYLRRYAPEHFSHHNAVYLFLIAIALSLLVLGPGALAFDLPL